MGVVQNSIDIEKLRASGGDPEIAERVAQLETEIGDENSGIIKDIDDLQEANALIMTSVSAIKTTADNALPVENNAGYHNSIYRGKSLGNSITADQWASISAGTFDDLFIGDYWEINSVKWRIAHFDYWLGTGDVNCTTHHVVIVPDTSLYDATMNGENTTASGYYGSLMRGGANYLVENSSNLYQAKTIIESAFGASHILSHRETITTAISGDNASAWAWHDSTIDLMSEVMLYGALAWSAGGKGNEIGIDKEQLALFRLDHSKISIRVRYWLRNIFSAYNFTDVYSDGNVYTNNASISTGVRPVFAIK